MPIDAHVHLPYPRDFGRHCSEALFRDVSEAVKLARGAGVTGMVFTTWLGVFCDTAEEVDAANRDALELYGTMPEYLYPGVVIHPRAVKTSLAWLDRFRERGLVWVGELVPYRCGIDFDRPEWTPLFERCRDNGQIVQLHNSAGVVALAERMPELNIVCAHITAEWLAPLAALPNVRLDLSGANGGLRLGSMESALAAFGPERLLWATDYTAFDPACFVTRLERAVPDPVMRRKIGSGNLLRLLASAGSVPAFGGGR